MNTQAKSFLPSLRNLIPKQAPSFNRALLVNVVGLVIVLEVVLLVGMAWQSFTSTNQAAQLEAQETLARTTERLNILIRAAEMTGESAERAARAPEISSSTLRATIERSLAAFEQRPELSYLGIVLAATGEYGNLERTAKGEILLWLFPGAGAGDQTRASLITRNYLQTNEGFVPHSELTGYDYDPRTRPFYQAALNSPSGETWMPTYRWIVHGDHSESLWGFSYVKVLRNKDGHLLGVLDSDFDLPALNRFLRNLESEYHTRIQVVELSDTPRLIGASHIKQEPLEITPELKPLLSIPEGVFVEKMQLGTDQHWVAANRLKLKGGLSWLLVTSRPTPFINALLLRQLYQVGAMGLLIALGLVFVSMRMARRFSEPLAELERQLVKIGLNQLPVPAPSGASNAGQFRETQLLGQALDHMRIVVSQFIESKEQQAASLMLKGVIFDSTNTAILSVDQKLAVIEWNRAAERLFGLSREQVIGQNIMQVVFINDGSGPWTSMLAARELSTQQFIGRHGVFDAEFRVAAFKSGGQDVHTLFIDDISERKHAEERIRYLATHDDLTGLPNRTLIMDRIVQAIRHARRSGLQLALLYLDLDRFKVLNDGYGHSFGDAVLKAAAERLSALVREGDTVSRHGGDEFLILLTGLHSSADVYIATEKIVKSLDCPILVDNRKVHLSGSIGVSVFPHDGDTPEMLIDNADVAMYRAKELGRNTYQFFTPEMSAETQWRVTLENYLREAVAEDQFQLAFQPKVNLASGRIVGCEALLRWHHPKLGNVSPDQFIPIAEDSGLIVPIGDWVLRTACAQARAWNDSCASPTCVAVNISARQFLQQDVASWVIRTLQQTGLAPEQLELEFTESLIARDVKKVIATFGQLRKIGVKLSIDDFGTGYSSLSYLKRFRVDTLKIDQSFVRDMLTDPEDAAIVRAVISLAHSLEFKVIAEGVETAEHNHFLQQNGCDEIQGFYFSKPVPAQEFEAMLLKGM
ncbi:MAG TPA: EAL domain-containing protein [Cellvibrionaceae bacterium]